MEQHNTTKEERDLLNSLVKDYRDALWTKLDDPARWNVVCIEVDQLDDSATEAFLDSLEPEERLEYMFGRKICPDNLTMMMKANQNQIDNLMRDIALHGPQMVADDPCPACPCDVPPKWTQVLFALAAIAFAYMLVSGEVWR